MGFQLELRESLPFSLIFLQWKRYAQKRVLARQCEARAASFFVTKLCFRVLHAWRRAARCSRLGPVSHLFDSSSSSRAARIRNIHSKNGFSGAVVATGPPRPPFLRAAYSQWKFNERWVRRHGRPSSAAPISKAVVGDVSVREFEASETSAPTSRTAVGQCELSVLSLILQGVSQSGTSRRAKNSRPRQGAQESHVNVSQCSWRRRRGLPSTFKKRFCARFFERWQRYRQQRVQADRSGVIVAEKRRLRLLELSLVHRWRAALLARQTDRAVTSFIRRRLLARVWSAWQYCCLEARADILRKYSLFHRWQRNAARSANLQQRGAKVASRTNFRIKSTWLAAWRENARVQRLRKRVVSRHFLRRWQIAVQRSVRRATAEQAVCTLLHRNTLACFLLRWRHRLRQARTGTRARVVYALRRWASNATAQREWKTLRARAALFWRRRAATQAFRALAHHVRQQDHCRGQAQTAEYKHRRAFLRTAFGAWRDACTIGQNSRLATFLGRRAVLRQRFVQWMRLPEVEHAATARCSAVEAHRRSKLLQGFRALRKNVLAAFQVRLASALKAKHDKALIAKCFRCWDRFAYEGGMEAFRMRTAQRFHDERLRRRAFFALVCALTVPGE